MSFLDIIEHFSTGATEPTPYKYTVTRYAARTYGSDGKLVAIGAPTTELITAGIQPMNGRDLQVLVEIAQTSEGRKVYTEVPLQTRRPGQEPDEITIAGEPWVVYTCVVWEGFGEVVYESLVARKALT